MPKNPIGLHIQAQDPRINRTQLLDHCWKADYSTVTVMDDFDLAIAIKNVLPNCVVVFRASGFEPEPDKDPINHLKTFLNSLPKDKRIVIMVNCEQGFSIDRVNMYCDMIPVAAALGWNLCVGSPSSGSVKSGQGADPNFWLSCKRLFEVLAANPGNFLAVHEYTSFFAWAVSNGQWGTVDGKLGSAPAPAPAAIDWNKDQWHLGRNLQGILKALKVFGIPISKIKVVITECVIDDMDDIDQMYPTVKSNGWRALIDWWRQVFPGQNAEDILADNHIWVAEKIWLTSGIVVGGHVYCYLDASGNAKWEKFRVDNAPKYLKRMEDYRSPNSAPTVDPELTSIVDPLPDDSPLWLAGTIQPSQGVSAVNVRYASQETGNKPIALIQGSYGCLYAHNPAWGEWAQVKYADNGKLIFGWINTKVTIFIPTIVITPAPPTTYENIITLVSQARLILAAIDAEIAAIQKEN